MLLTTSRLALRELTPADFPAVREIDSDRLAQRFENPPYTEDETRLRLEKALADARDPAASGRHRFAITVRPGNTLRGWIVLTRINSAIREYEIGWTLHRADWGHGYAPEAAREVLRFAFENLNAHRVIAICHAENLNSLRVMAKLGMQVEGRLRETRWLDGRWYDEYISAILEREFAEQASQSSPTG